MMEIAGVPILGHIIGWLRKFEIETICVNLHYLPQVITDYLGDGVVLGVAVNYSVEPHLLGSAGGVREFLDVLPDTFVVAYGDVVTNADLGRLMGVHRETRADATLFTMEVDNPTECGIVATAENGRITRMVEKPAPSEVFSTTANAGVYVVNKQVLSLVPDKGPADFGHDIFPRMLESGMRLQSCPLWDSERLIDIGTPEKLALAQELFG